MLARDPLCVHCLADGVNTPAVHVDHIYNDPSDNRLVALQGLCHECHSRKTNIDMGNRVSHGCDAFGNPLDPDHEWNKSPAVER